MDVLLILNFFSYDVCFCFYLGCDYFYFGYYSLRVFGRFEASKSSASGTLKFSLFQWRTEFLLEKVTVAPTDGTRQQNDDIMRGSFQRQRHLDIPAAAVTRRSLLSLSKVRNPKCRHDILQS